jgi:hypothetical protein
MRHRQIGTLLQHRDYLFRRTSGSIGSLAKLLTGVTMELISNTVHTDEALTEAVMATIELDPSPKRTTKSNRRTSPKAAKPSSIR